MQPLKRLLLSFLRCLIGERQRVLSSANLFKDKEIHFLELSAFLSDDEERA